MKRNLAVQETMMISKLNPTTPTTPSADQRDPFPATIPEAFGFNSHYWDFAQGGNRGALETWSLEKWEAPWGQLDPMADMGRSGFPLHCESVCLPVVFAARLREDDGTE